MKALGKVGILLALLLVFSQRLSATDWTFMVYLDGDNNLESAGITDFLEMATVGSDANVDIIVQFDRIPGYATYPDVPNDWEDCQRFRVTNGMTPTVANAIPDWGDGQGGGREVNMGDPATLTAFINWGITNYPATNYALVLWNHGDGWRAMMERLKGESGGIDNLLHRSVCIDDTDNDSLYIYEVVAVLDDAPAAPNNIDLLGFDACFMGMVEVAYEVSKSTNPISIVVGSEESEPNNGWPYDTILTDLLATPGMNAATLGTTIVNKYGVHYAGLGNEDTTQSAIDLTQMDALATAIDAFVTAMEGADSWTEIMTCRGNSQEFSALWSEVGGSWYLAIEGVDLYDFADLVAAAVPAIAAEANAVKAAVVNAVIAEYHGTGSVVNSNGLAIYFPNRDDGFYQRYYENIANYNFPNDTTWDDFLKNYLIDASPVPAISSSWLSVTPTIDGEISAGEWTDATAVNITGFGIGQAVTAYIKNDGQYLYIAINDPNDNTLDADDAVGIYFDDDHNHQWDIDLDTDEGNYRIRYNGAAWVNEFRGIYNDGTYPYPAVGAVAAPEITSSVSLVSLHMQYEIKINLTTGALRATPGSTIGFYLFCYDNTGAGFTDGEWSIGFSVTGPWREPLHYGHLTTATAPGGNGGNGGNGDDGYGGPIGGGCFIATAAFGTEMAEEVKILSKFRDDILLKTVAGRDLVELYYATSPPIAKFIKHQPLLKSIVRIGLKPLIWFSRLVTE